jgi:hypothetical protein
VGKSRKTAKEAGQKSEVDARFLSVIAAFARDRSVTHGGKGFGSTGLKVNGKEWVAVRSSNVGWTELAREAHRFVKGLSS